MWRRAIGSIVVGWIVVLVGALSPLATNGVAADEGWTISRDDAQIAVDASGLLDVVETISVDFGSLSRHGIVREIPVAYAYDREHNRRYDLTVLSVVAPDGRDHPFQVESDGGIQSIRIGDPDVLVSDKQDYVIHYQVRGALNGFADHDELYWNASGAWPVPIERATTTVTLPGPGLQRVACYEGLAGSTEECASSATDRVASFEAVHSLASSEELTVVVGFAKGIVSEPQPLLEAKPRAPIDYFQVTPATLAGGGAVTLAVLGGLGALWWKLGRDHHYTSLHYLTDDPREETRPLLSRDPIVIEYQPPDGLRPAEMGLLLDERVDPLDATATIVDLAARGYLTIEPISNGKKAVHPPAATDWQIARTARGPDDLAPYETALFQGLFARHGTVRLSELKNYFHASLETAQDRLYDQAAREKWFASRPDRTRGRWLLLGLGVVILSGLAAYYLGQSYGAAIVALPVAVGGWLLMILSFSMPRRTARGRELLRRTLGFRRYVATAETSRQRYNEAQNLFAAYLPYAIVFRCVDKWARAFADAERQAATGSWYVGSSHFNASSFSRDFQGFSSQLATTITSTPGGSGSSGFSGGSSGGGGGGGGGHSW